MKESNHWLQLGGVERCNAGLELGLQVVLHDAHVSYPDREHVLVQGVYQGKEFIQVLVLEREREKLVGKAKARQCRNGGYRKREEKKRERKMDGRKESKKKNHNSVKGADR